MSSRVHGLALATLLAVAFAARAGWGLRQPAVIDERLPDQREYLALAENLLRGEGLKFHDSRPAIDTDVYAYRTPGYPFFLAAFGASPRTARLAQALLDTSTVLAMYLLCRRWLPAGSALAGSGLVAFNPFLIYFSGLILTETLFVAILAWGMVLLAWRRSILWGGMLLALSALVRPSALALPTILGAGAMFMSAAGGSTGRPGRVLLRLALLPILTTAVLFPWALRNRIVLGQWIWTTTNEGITRYDGFNPQATGASNQDFLTSPQAFGLKNMSEVQRNRDFSAQANRWIDQTLRKDPLRLAKLALAKVARTWSPIPLSRDFGSNRLYVLAAFLFSIPFDLLVVLGLWKAGLSRRAKLFLLLPALYFTVVHGLSVGSLRYRMPAEPPLAVLAAAGLVSVTRRRTTMAAARS